MLMIPEEHNHARTERKIRSERCELLADYIIEYDATVRLAASHFGIGKSTVHKDVTIILRGINPLLFEQVRRVLERNKAERHLRGGEATKLKYLAKRVKKEELQRLS